MIKWQLENPPESLTCLNYGVLTIEINLSDSRDLGCSDVLLSLEGINEDRNVLIMENDKMTVHISLIYAKYSPLADLLELNHFKKI